MKYLMREHYVRLGWQDSQLRLHPHAAAAARGKMLGMRDVINGKTRRNARGILNDASSAIAPLFLGFS